MLVGICQNVALCELVAICSRMIAFLLVQGSCMEITISWKRGTDTDLRYDCCCGCWARLYNPGTKEDGFSCFSSCRSIQS